MFKHKKHNEHTCTKCKKKWHCGITEMDPVCPLKDKALCQSCKLDRQFKLAEKDTEKFKRKGCWSCTLGVLDEHTDPNCWVDGQGGSDF